MAIPESELPHRYLRIVSNKTSHTDIHKIQKCQSNTYSTRQYNGLNIFDEDGGGSRGGGATQNLNIVELVKEILDSSKWMLSHQTFMRVSQISGFPQDKFICIPSITSDINLCCIETRS